MGVISRRSPPWLRSSTLTGTLAPLASPPPSLSPLQLLPPTALTSGLTVWSSPRRNPRGGQLLPTRFDGRCQTPLLTITHGRLLCRHACSARHLTRLV